MSLIPALIMAGALSLRFRRRIEETLAPSVFILTAILYFSGIFTTLLAGAAACLAVSAIALFYILRAVRIKGFGDVKDYFLTAGALALIFYAVFFIFVCAGREFYMRDDLSHWGLSVKNMLYWHDLSNIAASTDKNGSYPPATALWNYLGALMTPRDGNFFVNRGSTPINDAAPAQFFSQAMLGAALWLPVFSGIKSLKDRHELPRFIFALAAMPLILTGTFDDAWSSVMTDPLMGLYGFYILYCALRLVRDGDESDFARFKIAGGLFMLALTKEMGMVLAALLVLVAILVLGRERFRVNVVPLLAGLLLAPVSWYGYLAAYNRLGAASGGGLGTAAAGHLGKGVTGLFSGLDPELSWDITRDYIYGLDNWHAGFGAHLTLTFAKIMFVLAAAVILRALLIRTVSGGKFIASLFDNTGRLLIFSWLSGWLYAGLLLLAYLTVFRSTAAELPSMERYLAPVIVMQIGLISALIIEGVPGKRERRGFTAIVTAALILALIYGDEAGIIKAVTVRDHRDAPVSFLREDIDEWGVVFKPGDRVFLVMQEENISDVRYALCYLVTPAAINRNKFRLLDGGEPMTGAEFKELLGDNYSYIYLKSIDDSFIDTYGEIFLDRGDIRSDAFYRRDTSGYFTLVENVVE